MSTSLFEEKKELKSGTEMKMVIETLRHDEQGNEIVSYMFRPVIR